MTDLNEWLLVWCHVSILKLGGGGRGCNFDISAEASLGNLKIVTTKLSHFSNFGDETQQEVEFKFLI